MKFPGFGNRKTLDSKNYDVVPDVVVVMGKDGWRRNACGCIYRINRNDGFIE
jgi:hypothetical protein